MFKQFLLCPQFYLIYLSHQCCGLALVSQKAEYEANLTYHIFIFIGGIAIKQNQNADSLY